MSAESPLAHSREDPLAFADFYRELSTKVFEFFSCRTWNGQVSLDLTAETFAKAFEKRGDFAGHTDEQAAGWLWAIARNELGAYWRERAACQRAVERLAWQGSQNVAEELLRVEERATIEAARSPLKAAMKALTADQREAIGMRLLQERGYDEIADRLGVSSQLVRARVSRGLRALRQSPELCDSVAD